MAAHSYTDAPGIPPYTANTLIFMAARIAAKYRNIPTAQQLMADFGMSRATAYRWRTALVAARNEFPVGRAA